MLPIRPLLCLLLTAAAPAFGAPAVLPAPAAAPRVDLLPLKKALAPLSSAGTLETHSTLRMTAVTQGLSVTLREDLQIVSRRPGLFRSKIVQHASVFGPQTRLEVVSNGLSVWTFRPGQRRYSVSTPAAFKGADEDVSTLGLAVGGLSLGEAGSLADAFQSITPSNSADVASLLAEQGVLLSRTTQSAAGMDDYVYSLTLPKQNLTYKFYVSTQSSALVRIDLAGIYGGIQATYREDIASLTSQPPPPPSTFVFTPPPGAAKFPVVPVNPY